MHSVRSNSTSHIATRTASPSVECIPTTRAILHQNRYENSYSNKAYGSQPYHLTCRDRMEPANDSGARWRVTCEPSRRVQSCRRRTGGTT
eukprot:461750-Pleurochrysis_carterae.AAC.1